MNKAGESAVDPVLSVYCHVPFCASTCDFCAFYQEKPRRGDLDRYLAAMDTEFALLPKDRVVDTVFWGGGTPGLLAAKDLERLGRSLLDNLKQPPSEWTIEMAPSTVKEDKLAVLRDLGVTRISMGVQSFHPELLESLGRLHRPNQIYTAWERVQAAGFPQTNLDLMFAIPNQSIEQWEADIREAARLGPTHLSTYCLTFEEDTALYVKLSQGKVSIDEERELQFYERGWELLAELGYAQYEVSNFAKPDAACLHNVNTWRMQEWIGCGPSAASQYEGQRYQRPSNLDEWAKGMEAGLPPRTECVDLDASILLADALVFGLRMNAGCDLDLIAKQFPAPDVLAQLEPLLSRLAREGLAEREGSKIRLTHEGRLVCDAIGSSILETIAD
ncbi:MAG: radical SAM family heme chaperone HemW [Opitutales bacterium]|nr:radical SAM family heme chaperone HemW [Opitutales bacterium]MDP4643189.1 radical SAM family heme chaperone HemW [Opitutales bacterium]MDP4776487.1 radical SAM family heme chaperone HemW [Opitutales bacterium]MDP5079144.1 radical SAM family heme chaperone HemW [Opitutales bacterium]